jgi:transitional endoplasmic reticulum ATPase
MGWYKCGHRGLYSAFLEDEDVVSVTGFRLEIDPDDDKIIWADGKRIKLTDSAISRLLKRHLENLRVKSVDDGLSFFANIELLGNILELNAVEKAIMSFATALDIFPYYKSIIASRTEKTSTRKLAQIIAHLTGHSEEDVRAGLREDGSLIAGGIIHLDDAICDLEEKIAVFRGISYLLLQHHENEDALIGKLLKRTSPPSLGLENFPHLTSDINAINSYLSKAINSNEPGTNILFYGAPGTGKTELVKAIAAKLNADLYEVDFADEEGKQVSGEDRLRAYYLCQKLLSGKHNSLLMFDEIEDVFPSQGGFLAMFGLAKKGSEAKSGKAWINRTLERNITPAIWLTNDPDIDPAYLRRFDYSTRFPVPPQQVRMSIARHHLGQFNPTEEWLARIANNEQMTPAQYESAAKVARVSSGSDMELALTLVEQTLDRSATLLGQKRTPARNILHTGYDLRFTNASIDVEKIIAGLKSKPRGTFCFYGPAGTGKSEYARHITDAIGKPLLVRRASDILSMWVGVAEKNIAQMFAEARQQEAVLVLDEADSFLADRRDAQRSWEVTQVNELLTQMEAFEGIFVCTTNLMEKLDQASLRRFAFKVKFDFLNPDQRWKMFLNELVRLGGNSEFDTNWESQVRGLDKLTPGDFSVAARQFDVMDIQVTPGELFRLLQEECNVKGSPTGKIGFM